MELLQPSQAVLRAATTQAEYSHKVFLLGLEKLAALSEMYQPKQVISASALSHLPIDQFIAMCSAYLPEETDFITAYELRMKLVSGTVNPRTGVTVRLPVKAQETSRIYATVYKKYLVQALQKALLKVDTEQLRTAFPREFVSALRTY
jgi:hypothetical protein